MWFCRFRFLANSHFCFNKIMLWNLFNRSEIFVQYQKTKNWKSFQIKHKFYMAYIIFTTSVSRWTWSSKSYQRLTIKHLAENGNNIANNVKQKQKKITFFHDTLFLWALESVSLKLWFEKSTNTLKVLYLS